MDRTEARFYGTKERGITHQQVKHVIGSSETDGPFTNQLTEEFNTSQLTLSTGKNVAVLLGGVKTSFIREFRGFFVHGIDQKVN